MQAFCGQYNLDATSCSSIYDTVTKLYAPYTPIKPTVNSFDIFDTILARDVIQPNDIFSIVEMEYPYPNFRQLRQQAGDRANGTFDDIYKNFQDLTGEDSRVIEQLQRFEVDCELNHTYLIEQNYRLVRDGDILITDMYLPYEVIAKLLKHAGYDKSTNIYASAFGKSHGWMWTQLLTMYNIEKHVGDNFHSDVKQAQKYGVSADLTDTHQLSLVERKLATVAPIAGAELALLLRRFRHRNPYPMHSKESQLFLDQAEFNIPLLLLVSHEIREIMRRERLTRLLLMTRQGCLLEKLFPALYADVEVFRFASSRRAFKFPTAEYLAYIQELYLPGQTLIFDLQGTFKLGLPVFRKLFKADPRVHVLVHRTASVEEGEAEVVVDVFEGLSFCFQSAAFFYLEDLNVDLVGPLITMYKDGDGLFRESRGPVTTYSVEDATIYHQAVGLFASTVNCTYLAELLDRVLSEAVIVPGETAVCSSIDVEALATSRVPSLRVLGDKGRSSVSEKSRQLLSRIIPCRGQVHTLQGEFAHKDLSLLIKDNPLWPWSQSAFSAHLEEELDPWYGLPITVLLVDSGYGLSDEQIESIANNHFYVLYTYFGKQMVSVFIIVENFFSPAPSSTDLPSQSSTYSRFVFRRGEGHVSLYHDLTAQNILNDFKAEKFDIILESNVSCAIDEGTGHVKMTTFQRLNEQLVAAEVGQPDLTGLIQDLRAADGHWYYAMQINFSTCEREEGDTAALTALEKAHIGRLYSSPSQSPSPSSRMLPPYWFGNVLVFRGTAAAESMGL